MNIGILGSAGRMGQMLVREVARTDGAHLSGGADRAGHPLLGQDIASLAGLSASGVVLGGAGDDVLHAEWTSTSASLDGGDGNDTLSASMYSTGATLLGGLGNLIGGDR